MYKIVYILSLIIFFQGHTLMASEKMHDEIAHDEKVISMPEGCYSGKKEQCVIKSLTKQIVNFEGAQLEFYPQTVVRVSSFLDKKIQLLEGRIKLLSTKSEINISNIKLAKGPSYISQNKNEVWALNGGNAYLYKVQADMTSPEKMLLDRYQLLKFLSVFSSSKDHLKKQFLALQPIYDIQFKNDIALQKQLMQRKIASLEQKQKEFELQRQKKLQDQKELKKQFFKRTFDR